MKCHDVLGISEKASEEEILSAYTQKIAQVEMNTDVRPSILEKKRQELNTAKEDCLIWKNESFSSRISSRVSEFSSQVTSPNRLNMFCCDCCYCLLCLTSFSLAISFLMEIKNDKQKKAEEQEKERFAKLQSSEQECRSTLKTMLSSLSAESAKNSLEYIMGIPEDVPTHDSVDRMFAISEVRQHIGSIDNACMRAIYNHRLEDAAQYLKLLNSDIVYLHSQSQKYKVLADSINCVITFLNAPSPFIISTKYAEVNTSLVDKLCAIHAGASLSIDSYELQSLVWSMALEDPLDFYSYRALINQLSSSGMSVDMISSLIYIESKYGRTIVERVRQSYWNDLCSFISRSTPNTIWGLASISSWCGNRNVEIYALEELHERRQLPDNLKERYDLIKNRL